MATSLLLPELIFLSPQTFPKRRLCLSGHSPCRNRRKSLAVRTRIRAVNEEGVAVEERERRLVKELNGNGAASGSRYGAYSNGGVGVSESENGSLVKYVNGNGVAAAAAEVVLEVEDPLAKEAGRKRRVEEIGKEDAWFKQAGGDSVEVKWVLI
jgi:hypothetical protein